MSALRQPRSLLTAEEYLQLERQAEFKSEFVNGHIYAMAGARVNHNRIAANVLASLRVQLRPRPCEVFGSIGCNLTLEEIYEKVTFAGAEHSGR